MGGTRIIAYERVSTARQGRSGLGLEAQRSAIDAFAASRSAEVLARFTEVESGKRNDRPELEKALTLARLTGATLVIAKLDRLSRNAAFLLTLQSSGVSFLACDMPKANDLTVGIMALVAQAEREAISRRTKEALAAAKARGVKLGNPNGAAALRRAGKGGTALQDTVRRNADAFAEDLRDVVETIRAEGHTTLRFRRRVEHPRDQDKTRRALACLGRAEPAGPAGPRLNVATSPGVLTAQAQKHVTHNEALRILDGLVQLSVLDWDLTAPPGSPADGDRYIVGSGATGEWAGWDLNVALWTDGAWLRLPPRICWRAWVEDEGLLLVYDGSGWIGTRPAVLQNLALLGIGTTADASNPFSAKLNAALWTAKTVAEGGTGDLF